MDEDEQQEITNLIDHIKALQSNKQNSSQIINLCQNLSDPDNEIIDNFSGWQSKFKYEPSETKKNSNMLKILKIKKKSI